ncbi:MAG TPA: CopD family protein [Edaphobacter sp.]|nr:CopD family protein [Edaphobacter sp.]
MIWLLRDFDLLSVLLRALTLGLEMLTLGGVAYLLAVALPAKVGRSVTDGCWRGIRFAAASFVIVELCYVAVDSAILMGSSSLGLGDVAGAPYFVAGTCAVIAAVAIVICAREGGRRSTYALVFFAALVLVAVVSTSHSVSRLDHRIVLTALTAAHQLGAAVWIGAMPFLLISLRRSESVEEAKRQLLRFSPMALAGAGTLLAGGVCMAWFYLGISADKSMSGLYGTAYGVMMASKTFLVLAVMALGAGNFFLIRRIDTAPAALLTRLRRFGEVEIGLGFIAVLAAASMTSSPPAADLPKDRVQPSEIIARFRPVIPRMTSPAVSELPPPEPLNEAVSQFSAASTPINANNVAWSEYNHHWSGLIVLLAGVFALLSRLPKARWARNWPLVFAALAVFIALRADSESWPLGPRPFWVTMYEPDVLQHRLSALLIVALAAFEWGIQTGRLKSRWAAMMFPMLCVVGAALLLTHNHFIGNVKEELLAEMSHTPIALLGATAGCSRWLELRLPDRRESRWASYVWPVCLVLVGLVLLNYREA